MTRQSPTANLPQAGVEALARTADQSAGGGGADERSCNWEKFSGICMICGAGPDDECEVERERRCTD